MAISLHKPGPPDAEVLMMVYGHLLEHFGAQHWWPGDSPLEAHISKDGH